MKLPSFSSTILAVTTATSACSGLQQTGPEACHRMTVDLQHDTARYQEKFEGLFDMSVHFFEHNNDRNFIQSSKQSAQSMNCMDVPYLTDRLKNLQQVCSEDDFVARSCALDIDVLINSVRNNWLVVNFGKCVKR